MAVQSKLLRSGRWVESTVKKTIFFQLVEKPEFKRKSGEASAKA
jgi:hypothetical protein